VPRDQHDPSRDGAALLSGDPLERYRRLPQGLRRRFAPFTRAVCPGCPTPCCRRPAAVTPFDVTLAEELDYRLPAGPEAAGEAIAVALGLIPVPTLASEGEPCAFLGRRGCTFPADLMPFGCVAFLCPYMKEWYSGEQFVELQAGVDELKAAYVALQAALLDAPINSP
jgi:hypothetical protein